MKELITISTLGAAIEAAKTWDYKKGNIYEEWCFENVEGDICHWPANRAILQYAEDNKTEPEHALRGAYSVDVTGRGSIHSHTFFGELNDLVKSEIPEEMGDDYGYTDLLQRGDSRHKVIGAWKAVLKRLQAVEKSS